MTQRRRVPLLFLASVALAGLACIPLPAATPAPTDTPRRLGFEVLFIDVGQGDATLIRSASGETLLIDGGRSRSRLRERLQTLGVTDLDAALATHADLDHIGGLVEAFALFEIERFYWNGYEHHTQAFRALMSAAAAEGSEVTVLRRNDTVPLGDLTLTVLHPAVLTNDTNVDSIVVLLQCGAVDVLLTGDAETPSEEDMLAAGVLADVDVLKIGHHGSRTSTSPTFLAAVAPEVGVISAGLVNQYGHPHEEVVAQLEVEGVTLWETDTSTGHDAVILESDCASYSLRKADGPTE